jgi:hypothetical protein
LSAAALLLVASMAAETPQPLPVAAAVVPGVLLHGSGHFAAGERMTAYRLVRAEALGLGLIAAGLGTLVVTGSSPRTIEPAIWTVSAGVGLFGTSWLADLYGVLAPPGGVGAPLRVLPVVEARMGGRYVADPTVVGAAFVGPALDLRLGRWRLSPAAWLAIDGSDVARYEAAAAFRIVGPRAGTEAAAAVVGDGAGDGSFLDLVAGGVHHRYREDVAAPLLVAWDTTTFSLHAEGRLDLRRWAASLTGAFVDAALGAGAGAYHYPAASTTELSSVLLGGFGFGLYLGRRAARWGEARAYYDHRHDDFAGGLKMRGLGSGPAGHFGLDGRAYVTERWGVRGEVQVGAAWVAGLSLLYRYGRVEL